MTCRPCCSTVSSPAELAEPAEPAGDAGSAAGAACCGLLQAEADSLGGDAKQWSDLLNAERARGAGCRQGGGRARGTCADGDGCARDAQHALILFGGESLLADTVEFTHQLSGL